VNFVFNSRIFRRCHWLVFRTAISFGEFLFASPCVLQASTHKMKCGRFTVFLVNCKKGDRPDREKKHKELADVMVRVLESPELSSGVRGAFEKIQKLFIIRGTIQNNVLCRKMFATINPPLNDFRKCVRTLIAFILLTSKYREEYFIRYRSNKENRTIATEFMNQSMHEVDVVITEVMREGADGIALRE